MKQVLIIIFLFCSLCIWGQDFLMSYWGDSERDVTAVEGKATRRDVVNPEQVILHYQRIYMGLPASVSFTLAGDKLVTGLILVEGYYLDQLLERLRQKYNMDRVGFSRSDWASMDSRTLLGLGYSEGFTRVLFDSLSASPSLP